MSTIHQKEEQSGNTVEKETAIIEWRETFADAVVSFYDSATKVFDFALYRLERGDTRIEEDLTCLFNREYDGEMLRDFKTWKELANHCAAHMGALRVPYYLLTGYESDKSLWQCPEVARNARLYFDAMIEELERKYLEKRHQPDAYNFAEDWQNSGLAFSDLLD